MSLVCVLITPHSILYNPHKSCNFPCIFRCCICLPTRLYVFPFFYFFSSSCCWLTLNCPLLFFMVYHGCHWTSCFLCLIDSDNKLFSLCPSISSLNTNCWFFLNFFTFTLYQQEDLIGLIHIYYFFGEVPIIDQFVALWPTPKWTGLQSRVLCIHKLWPAWWNWEASFPKKVQ